MTRIARVVVPGLPHHVTQRGNHRDRIFFEDGDYALYCDGLAESRRDYEDGDCGDAIRNPKFQECLGQDLIHLISPPRAPSA